MNKTALKAAFNSPSFRCRFHGAMVRSIKKDYSHYVKNRNGENFLRVTYNKGRGFVFFCRNGQQIDNKIIFNFLRQAA